ncbi:hypothetical protein E2C01_074327 [Portunus trituberculatus]|uniref:Uncharacterized protein n=1 Tax=Portunus trituberculatus TaxID=210409 RepID=A0A5B7I333_PORTR|nr:hypothetical protein [Portunus trituberculatus]
MDHEKQRYLRNIMLKTCNNLLFFQKPPETYVGIEIVKTLAINVLTSTDPS